MINLSDINLSSVNLGGLDLSGIKLGYSGGKTGPVSGLSGVLGYWDTLGLTNEIMKVNPVWKDKSEFKNNIRLNNIAWALSSGVGLYKMDFLNLTSNGTIIKHSSSKVEIKAGAGGLGAICYLSTTYTKGINLFIQNKPDNLNLLFGSTTIGQVSLTNGINEIEISPTSQVVGFFCNTAFSELNIVIEQTPDYAGAICFDGIDDYGVCQSFPVVTKDKGYTVMALRRYISIPEKYPSGFISKFIPGTSGAFSLETIGSIGNKAVVSFAASTPVSEFSQLITYQTSNDFNGTPIATASSKDTNELYISKYHNYYGQFAIYALCIIDRDTTQEERQKVIDKWKRDFPELFPQHSWSVKGKTNVDEDKAVIKNLTGNGNDLILSNFAFEEGSGYNSEGYLVTDGVDDRIVSKRKFNLRANWCIVGDFEFLTKKNDNCGLVKANSLYIYNHIGGMRVYLKQGSVSYNFPSSKFRAITSDGKIFDENWNEYEVYPIGSLVGDENAIFLYLGNYSSSNFTKLAFKNLAIYDSVLTKEQSIKAYDYLQTLKAK